MTAFEWLVERTVVRGWSLFAVLLVLLAIAAACTVLTVFASHPWLLSYVAVGVGCPWVAWKIWRAAL
ncbi:MAG: hypothetical protein QG550_862 [Pseudomonadota bacterium]|nr:hypothetical protein [Pseudomonadota bacterium]MDQ1343261.1 hypothetical protein [Pseudomonadota bacterium]